MGTSIIQSEILKNAGIVLNIHGGYLPDYRGSHCIFFALYQGNFDKIGSTIHFINSGIDTGDIIEVISPSLSLTELKKIPSWRLAEVFYCYSEKLAMHRLANLLEEYENGKPLPRKSQAKKGKLYRTSDRKLYHELFFWLAQNFIRAKFLNAIQLKVSKS